MFTKLIILQKRLWLKLFLVFTFLFVLTMEAEAVTVSNIELNPISPIYNKRFDCIFTIDIDEPNLACGLQNIASPLTETPKDICPKKEKTGYQKTENSKRYYRCIINSDTGVPSIGRYRIVAWYFWADGARGQAVASKEIMVIETPPPTATPFPISTLIPTTTKSLSTPTKNIYQSYPTQTSLSIPTVSHKFAQEITPTVTTTLKIIPFINPSELFSDTSSPLIKTRIITTDLVNGVRNIILKFLSEASF